MRVDCPGPVLTARAILLRINRSEIQKPRELLGDAAVPALVPAKGRRGNNEMRISRTPKNLRRVITQLGLVFGAAMTLTLCSRPVGAPKAASQRPPDSALFAAVRAGDAGTLSSLLARGGDPNAREAASEGNSRRPSLLHVAADDGNLALVEALLSAKADPNVRDNGGSTPLHGAVVEKVGATMVLAPEAQAGGLVSSTELRTMDPTEREKIVQVLVQHGADPNARSKGGTTPLETVGGDVTAPLKGIEALVECGAAVNVLDKRGRTPMDLSMFTIPGLLDPPPGGMGSLPSVKYLRSKGAKTARELKHSRK
jgi:hypothetical protein